MFKQKPTQMNGYDIDGVLTNGVIPLHPYVVITGRPINDWNDTITDIGIEAPLFMCPYEKNRENAAKWKSEIINKVGVTKFYEDDEWQAKYIEKNTKNCEVILVQ